MIIIAVSVKKGKAVVDGLNDAKDAVRQFNRSALPRSTYPLVLHGYFSPPASRRFRHGTRGRAFHSFRWAAPKLRLLSFKLASALFAGRRSCKKGLFLTFHHSSESILVCKEMSICR